MAMDDEVELEDRELDAPLGVRITPEGWRYLGYSECPACGEWCCPKVAAAIASSLQKLVGMLDTREGIVQLRLHLLGQVARLKPARPEAIRDAS